LLVDARSGRGLVLVLLLDGEGDGGLVVGMAYFAVGRHDDQVPVVVDCGPGTARRASTRLAMRNMFWKGHGFSRLEVNENLYDTAKAIGTIVFL
jgi:ferric-dicitrate binding protein FerR (iron transport regulator)